MLKAGTIIVCPTCDMPQLKSSKDLKPGQQLKEAGWDSLGFEIDSLRMGCFKCGSAWYRIHPISGKSQIFTKDEHWLTLDKEVPVSKETSLKCH